MEVLHLHSKIARLATCDIARRIKYVYMYEFQNKDITDDLYIDGYVLGYLVQSPGADNEVITPLPYTIHKGEADGDNALLWTETYTYDYMPGSVAFYVQYSDFIEQQPGDMVFRLVLNN